MSTINNIFFKELLESQEEGTTGVRATILCWL